MENIKNESEFTENNDSFGLIFSSDPQYPWYDGLLPEHLNGENQIKQNSERQIRQQYESFNALAKKRQDEGSPYPIKGVVINGDLTAYGHDWQFDKFKELASIITSKWYPGLGNHDYLNNVDDTANNNAASRMVEFMYGWLKDNSAILNYDFGERSYYQFPELRTDYSGSLSYSFNIGKLHVVQLQNFPSYTEEWNSWNFSTARRDFYYINPSFYWMENDLAQARNRGDVIIVNLHDYHDNFVEPGVSKFNDLVQKYGVSAIFAGHIHPDCGLIETIGSANIPFFRSGAASYQDYLVADLNLKSKTLNVSKMFCPYDGNYGPTGDTWSYLLNDTVPNPSLPVPPVEGYVTFFNDGGFVARFSGGYTSNGQKYDFSTGDMNLGNKKTYYIPPNSTGVWIKAQEQTGLLWEGWRTVFDLAMDSPPNKCYKLYGTTLNPKWNNDCS